MKYAWPLIVAVVQGVSGISFGQDLSSLRVVGRAERASDELIDRSIKDANGEVCAGLLVISDLDGLSFDSNNGIRKVNHSAGKDFLFLSPGERMVEVAKTGYKPLRIVLNDYGIRLKSGEVWQLQITGDKRLDQIPVTIAVEPADATIFIDGVNKGTSRTQQASPGKHSLRVEKEGFKPATQSIEVSPSSVFFSVKLLQVDVQPLSIKSVPAGARITLNSQEEGLTDKGVWRFPGRYRLRLTLAGYLDLEGDIDVVEGGKNEFTFALTKNSGTLRLQVRPADAKLTINKTDYSGKTQVELPPGRYKIEVEKAGYVGTSEVVDVALGVTLSKTYTLVARVGALQFSVQPLDARIVLKRNGAVQQEWQGMRLLKELPMGDYELEAKATGHASQTRKARIEEGKTAVEEIVLARSRAASTGPGTPVSARTEGMVLVEGGSFAMGSNDGESDEKPVHRVTVTSFYLDKCEVTVGQYRKFCEATGREMPPAPRWAWLDDHPIVNVTWDDANAYAAWAGKRLPTEAEWEYAARGSNRSRGYTYSGSNSIDDVAWYSGNSASQTHAVGQKQPNEIGLHDMSGNVWEWCADWYDANYYANSPVTDPKGPTTGQYRVLRGGSWVSVQNLARVAYRTYYFNPSDRINYIGFRCAQDVK